jgi:hypothetical protein
MKHRVDERSEQTKFHILSPYKKMELMPTFYSTLSTIFLIFLFFTAHRSHMSLKEKAGTGDKVKR